MSDPPPPPIDLVKTCTDTLFKAPATAVGTASWRAEKLGPAGSEKFKSWWDFAGVEGAPEVCIMTYIIVCFVLNDLLVSIFLCIIL